VVVEHVQVRLLASAELRAATARYKANRTRPWS
jgi:hypothetical protein